MLKNTQKPIMLKKGKKGDPQNYRPVSACLLSGIIMVQVQQSFLRKKERKVIRNSVQHRFPKFAMLDQASLPSVMKW